MSYSGYDIEGAKVALVCPHPLSVVRLDSFLICFRDTHVRKPQPPPLHPFAFTRRLLGMGRRNCAEPGIAGPRVWAVHGDEEVLSAAEDVPQLHL